MPVKPGGIEPWMGPMVRPGAGPCWACLAHRVRHNRPVEAYLERRRGGGRLRGFCDHDPRRLQGVALQCFIEIEPDEPLLAQASPWLGEDNAIFGTDFPHIDHDAGLVERALALRGRLPGDALRKILWDNAARFYGIEE